jgi:uncharacterized protein YukE
MPQFSIGKPDMALTYEEVDNVATVLNTAALNLAPQIQGLATTVTNMLQPQGGLWMNQTAPAIQSQYNTFNSAMLNCVCALGSFSCLFNGLVTAIQSMDSQSALQINNPSSS